MVAFQMPGMDDREKMLVMAKLAEASARLMSCIPELDYSSERYLLLVKIVDGMEQAALELKKTPYKS